MTLLTAQTLIEQDACPIQVTLFRELFGSSVEVDVDLCLSVAQKFSWDWASDHLLSAAKQADYERATAKARAKERARQLAALDHLRESESALDDYPVEWAKYKRRHAAARARCERAKALAFGKQYAS